jgi:hypothetical protein
VVFNGLFPKLPNPADFIQKITIKEDGKTD